MAFAKLQLSSRVVVNVVNTHFIHDAKSSLRIQRDLDEDGGMCSIKSRCRY